MLAVQLDHDYVSCDGHEDTLPEPHPCAFTVPEDSMLQFYEKNVRLDDNARI